MNKSVTFAIRLVCAGAGVILGLSLAAITAARPAEAHPAAQSAAPRPHTAQLVPGGLSRQASNVVAGRLVTQTFTLTAGWNTIYLEVEPINTSALVPADPPTDPPTWVHQLSSLEAVFASLSCGGCLESVWTWRTPSARMDYIVDPSEGLWNAAGWERYFPASNLGADGVSRGFLTTLLTLHAHTGYLVKLSDGFVGTATLQVTGTPVVGHRRWAKASYSLVGFPIADAGGPTAATLKASSAITDVLQLGNDGRWQRLADALPLQAGQAYLAYYGETTVSDYTAPLDLLDVPATGLSYERALGATSRTVRIENRASATTTVSLALVGDAASVALRYWPEGATYLTETTDLRTGPVTLALGPHALRAVKLTVSAREQPARGEGLLQVTAAALGTRWWAPVSAAPGSVAGLWVGEIVANDVSESRLGGTNVADGALTVALTPRNGSGLRGAVALQERIAGTAAQVAMTATLALSSTTVTTALTPISGTAPYVAGYVFADLNQNGQRDADEPGFGGVAVNLTASGATSTRTTAADGGYLFAGLTPGAYTIAVAPGSLSGYIAAFTITRPATETLPITASLPTAANSWPTGVTVDPLGITDLAPAAYKQQVLVAPYELPQYDASQNRREPDLNFGVVPVYDVSLWQGTCANRTARLSDLGQLVNGRLVSNIANASLNPSPGPGITQLLGGGATYVVYVAQVGGSATDAAGVACGELAAPAPTQSQFRYRVLLRVAADGTTELLSRYTISDSLRISSAALSLPAPVVGSGKFTDANPLLDFTMTMASQDPWNPFKHKYAPDHDNLDAKFNVIDPVTLAPYLWEVPTVGRHLKLELTETPPGGTAGDAVALDWGGTTWGGSYREVFTGLHKNPITVKGYFVIRQLLTASQLKPQSYDR